MENTTSLKPTEASKDNPSGKLPSAEKIIGLDPAILFFKIEYKDKTEN